MVSWYYLKCETLVGAFNQEKALEEAFSLIVKISPKVRLQLQYSDQTRSIQMLQMLN